VVVFILLVTQINNNNYYYDSYLPNEHTMGMMSEKDDKSSITAEDLGISYAQNTGLGSRSPNMLDSVRSKIGNLLSPVPNTDIREFLKTDYELNIKSKK
jgi:hypothetical protein